MRSMWPCWQQLPRQSGVYVKWEDILLYDTVGRMANVAAAINNQGRHDEATDLLRKIVRICGRVPPNSTDLAEKVSQLGQCLKDSARFAKDKRRRHLQALECFRRSLKL